jgi:hypothetical protein
MSDTTTPPAAPTAPAATQDPALPDGHKWVTRPDGSKVQVDELGQEWDGQRWITRAPEHAAAPELLKKDAAQK